MTTPNIVPRDNGQTLGTQNKQWDKVYAKKLYLNGDSLSDVLDNKANAVDLAAVATSGSYNDLEDKPDLTLKADKTSVYTKTEADSLISAKANANDVYTKAESNTLLNAKADKNELNNYLSLNGGIMNGNIGFADGDFSFKLTDDGKNLDIGWDYEARKGAGLGLRSVNNDRAGQFLLYARDGVNTCELLGKPDGALQWNSKDVERVHSQGDRWFRFEGGLQICWADFNVDRDVNGGGYNTFKWNYPVPFLDGNTPCISANAQHDRFNAGTNGCSSTACDLYYVNDSSSTFHIYWVNVMAIGRWK